MKNNSFHLYSEKKHLVFKSAINGSKLTFAKTGNHDHLACQVNKLIVSNHGVVDLTLSKGNTI